MDERNLNYKVQIELKKEKDKNHKRRVKALLAKASLLAMLLIVSTYAWFTSQKDITLSNIRGTVEVVENMEISLDAKNWYQQIDLTEAEVLFGAAQVSRNEALGETDSDAKSTALTILPEQLFPVSGVGEITSKTLLPLYAGEATSTSLSEIAQCLEETTDADGADIAVDNGYIAFDMYIKNTSRDNEDDVLQLNVNSVAQVLTESIEKTITDVTGNEVERTYTGNADSGLQNTVRVALAMYNGEIASTATQKEILESTKGATIKDLAIWEPNAYDHVESIVANNNKLINGTETNKLPFTENQTVDTYAISENAVGETITNVYDISSTGLGLQGTFKTDNVKDADGNVVDYRIYTETAKPLDIKNISGNDFVISSNEVTRFRVYVWLEGQDVDCINIASLGGGIELDLGLTKDNEIGDGAGSRLLASVDYDLSEITNGEVTATITANREIELPDGWSYGEVASYAVASTEPIKLAASSEVTNNVISKVFSGNTEEYVMLEAGTGVATVVRVKIEEFGNESTQITKDNIGDYVDLGNNIVKTNVTTDDWRIFYVEDTNGDEITDKVHLMLADYLPAEKVPADIGLLTNPSEYSKSVWSDSATNLLNGLKHSTAWDDFSNGYSTEVIGSPTADIIQTSLSENYGITQIWNNEDKVGEDYDLFVPHTEEIDSCSGYWLSTGDSSLLWEINTNGYVGRETHLADFYSLELRSTRPWITLTVSEVNIQKEGTIWKVSK